MRSFLCLFIFLLSCKSVFAGGAKEAEVPVLQELAPSVDQKALKALLSRWLLRGFQQGPREALVHCVCGNQIPEEFTLQKIAFGPSVEVQILGTGQALIRAVALSGLHTVNDLITEIKRILPKQSRPALLIKSFLNHDVNLSLFNDMTLEEAGIRAGSVVTLLFQTKEERQVEVGAAIYALIPKGKRFCKYADPEILEKVSISRWPGFKVNESGDIVDVHLTSRVQPLSGSIPRSVGLLTQLSKLDLGGGGLTGPIPSSIGDLTQLVDLYLPSNQLTGPIPSSIGRLKQLSGLNLERNQLTGPIPTEIFKLKRLWYCDLAENQFTIPEGFEAKMREEMRKDAILFLEDKTEEDASDTSSSSF